MRDDETFNRIIKELEDFINVIPSDEDKQIFLKLVSRSYYKHSKAIKSKSQGGYLMFSIIISLLMEQIKEIKMLREIMDDDRK